MARSQSFRTGFCLAGFSTAVHIDVNLLGKVPSQLLGHYLLHISFSSGTFSKVCAGRQPLPLYHYSATAKKFSSWTHEAMLLVKEVKSRVSAPVLSWTFSSCFVVH